MRNEEVITIKSRFTDYSVFFVSEINFPAEALIIVDANVLSRYVFPQNLQIVSIECTEEKKSLETIQRLIEVFQEFRIKKNSQVVFVGGGVIQDLGTFAASIYMRGLNWIYYPTTLQAMIDSCIGGKSSINFGTRKNILGSFHPPKQIQIWTNFLSSLEKEQIISGLIEGLKICLAANTESTYLNLLIEFKESNFSHDKAMNIIQLCLRSKKTFIEVDEFDFGVRNLLNYGHTFGHAIEASSNFKISHGTAVGIGILAAHNLARDLDLLDVNLTTAEIAVKDLLRELNSDLGEIAKELTLNNFIGHIRGDKKATSEKMVFILPTNSGLVKQELSFDLRNKARIELALTSVILGNLN
jgi:3-dehydroquinate synthase